MARISSDELAKKIQKYDEVLGVCWNPVDAYAERLCQDLKDCREILHDLYARMVDVYDGAPDTTNHLPFTGGDIRDIEEVLR